MAVLTTALTRLRADFNTRFPNRDKASDGWIGDTAHQQSASGHNPDDTAGSKAEYSDPDSKAEVRAIDVDVDFRDPVTAQQVVDAVISTPADRRRLRYVIYNRRVWSRNTDWEARPYTGANPHDKHIHFSGAPEADEDGRPWESVLTVGRESEIMAKLDDDDRAWLRGVLESAVHVVRAGDGNSDFAPPPAGTAPWLKTSPNMATVQAEMREGFRQLGAQVADVDEAVLAKLASTDRDAAARALIAVFGSAAAGELVEAMANILAGQDR